MAFYLDMLTENDEFLDNVGFDSSKMVDTDGQDKYEVELKDVADIIDDINDNYADQSSQEELDGQDLHEDPVSECMIAIYESECNWNMIMQAIGQREIMEAARGREMVMEAVDIKGFFNKAKEFFVKLFKKITAIVKNWIDNATAAFRTNKSFVQKYGSKFAEGKKAYEAAGGKAFKGYNFTSIGKKTVDYVKNMTDIVKSETEEVRKIISEVNTGKDDSYRTRTVADPSGIRARLCGKDSGTVSADEYRSELKIAYFGSKEKETLNDATTGAENLKGVLSRSGKDVKDIKEAYKALKKAFEASLKALKELEKAMQKRDDTSNRNNAMTAVTKAINNQKENRNAASTSLTMMMKALHAEKAQARRVANAYVFALNKGARKEKIEKLSDSATGFFGGLELL